MVIVEFLIISFVSYKLLLLVLILLLLLLLLRLLLSLLLIIDILHAYSGGVILHNLFNELKLLVVLQFNGLLRLVLLNGSVGLLLLHLETHIALVLGLMPVGVSHCEHLIRGLLLAAQENGQVIRLSSEMGIRGIGGPR